MLECQRCGAKTRKLLRVIYEGKQQTWDWLVCDECFGLLVAMDNDDARYVAYFEGELGEAGLG